MRIVLVSSTIDSASSTIKHCLCNLIAWEPFGEFLNNPVYHHPTIVDLYLLTINDRKITHDNLDNEIKTQLGITPDLMIFLSRHTSQMGKPSLTVHPIGNYGPADYGGKPQTLVPSAPN